MIIFIVLCLFNITFAQHQGEIICNLCVDTVEHVKEIVEEKGIESAREYLDGLCTQAPGFIANICTDIVNFGMDEILKMIENRVQPKEICEKMEACPIQQYQGPIVCNLCVGTINKLKDILKKNGGQKVKDYLDTLCAKASGFIATVCNKIVDFGIDKLIKLIEDKVDSNVICQKVHLC